MVAATPLGDVMEQHRDIEDAPGHDLADDRRGDGVFLDQFLPLDPREQPRGADGVLVDGVMMVHVELHLRHDAPEIGHEAAEDARFVHPAQHQFRVARGGQHVEEQRIGTAVVAHIVDQLGIA